jgi:hypothetical protein
MQSLFPSLGAIEAALSGDDPTALKSLTSRQNGVSFKPDVQLYGPELLEQELSQQVPVYVHPDDPNAPLPNDGYNPVLNRDSLGDFQDDDDEVPPVESDEYIPTAMGTSDEVSMSGFSAENIGNVDVLGSEEIYSFEDHSNKLKKQTSSLGERIEALHQKKEANAMSRDRFTPNAALDDGRNMGVNYSDSFYNHSEYGDFVKETPKVAIRELGDPLSEIEGEAKNPVSQFNSLPRFGKNINSSRFSSSITNFLQQDGRLDQTGFGVYETSATPAQEGAIIVGSGIDYATASMGEIFDEEEADSEGLGEIFDEEEADSEGLGEIFDEEEADSEGLGEMFDEEEADYDDYAGDSLGEINPKALASLRKTAMSLRKPSMPLRKPSRSSSTPIEKEVTLSANLAKGSFSANFLKPLDKAYLNIEACQNEQEGFMRQWKHTNVGMNNIVAAARKRGQKSRFTAKENQELIKLEAIQMAAIAKTINVQYRVLNTALKVLLEIRNVAQKACQLWKNKKLSTQDLQRLISMFKNVNGAYPIQLANFRANIKGLANNKIQKRHSEALKSLIKETLARATKAIKPLTPSVMPFVTPACFREIMRSGALGAYTAGSGDMGLARQITGSMGDYIPGSGDMGLARQIAGSMGDYIPGSGDMGLARQITGSMGDYIPGSGDMGLARQITGSMGDYIPGSGDMGLARQITGSMGDYIPGSGDMGLARQITGSMGATTADKIKNEIQKRAEQNAKSQGSSQQQGNQAQAAPQRPVQQQQPARQGMTREQCDRKADEYRRNRAMHIIGDPGLPPDCSQWYNLNDFPSTSSELGGLGVAYDYDLHDRIDSYDMESDNAGQDLACYGILGDHEHDEDDDGLQGLSGIDNMDAVLHGHEALGGWLSKIGKGLKKTWKAAKTVVTTTASTAASAVKTAASTTASAAKLAVTAAGAGVGLATPREVIAAANQLVGNSSSDAKALIEAAKKETLAKAALVTKPAEIQKQLSSTVAKLEAQKSKLTGAAKATIERQIADAKKAAGAISNLTQNVNKLRSDYSAALKKVANLKKALSLAPGLAKSTLANQLKNAESQIGVAKKNLLSATESLKKARISISVTAPDLKKKISLLVPAYQNLLKVALATKHPSISGDMLVGLKELQGPQGLNADINKIKNLISNGNVVEAALRLDKLRKTHDTLANTISILSKKKLPVLFAPKVKVSMKPSIPFVAKAVVVKAAAVSKQGAQAAAQAAKMKKLAQAVAAAKAAKTPQVISAAKAIQKAKEIQVKKTPLVLPNKAQLVAKAALKKTAITPMKSIASLLKKPALPGNLVKKAGGITTTTLVDTREERAKVLNLKSILKQMQGLDASWSNLSKIPEGKALLDFLRAKNIPTIVQKRVPGAGRSVQVKSETSYSAPIEFLGKEIHTCEKNLDVLNHLNKFLLKNPKENKKDLKQALAIEGSINKVCDKAKEQIIVPFQKLLEAYKTATIRKEVPAQNVVTVAAIVPVKAEQLPVVQQPVTVTPPQPQIDPVVAAQVESTPVEEIKLAEVVVQPAATAAAPEAVAVVAEVKTPAKEIEQQVAAAVEAQPAVTEQDVAVGNALFEKAGIRLTGILQRHQKYLNQLAILLAADVANNVLTEGEAIQILQNQIASTVETQIAEAAENVSADSVEPAVDDAEATQALGGIASLGGTDFDSLFALGAVETTSEGTLSLNKLFEQFWSDDILSEEEYRTIRDNELKRLKSGEAPIIPANVSAPQIEAAVAESKGAEVGTEPEIVVEKAVVVTPQAVAKDAAVFAAQAARRLSPIFGSKATEEELMNLSRQMLESSSDETDGAEETSSSDMSSSSEEADTSSDMSSSEEASSDEVMQGFTDWLNNITP